MSLLKKGLFLLVMSPCLVLSQNFYLGESNQGSGAGNLYSIDAATCALSTIGAMGTSVTGLASDASGSLFATEATQFGNSNLLSINTTTGAPSVIGLLTDGVDIYGSVPDITFRGSTLYGWSELNDTAVTIDTATGTVTDLGNNSASSAGSGLAANSSGTLYVVPCAGCGFTPAVADDSDLFTVDPTTGVLTQVTDLIDNTTNGDVENGAITISAMTFDNTDSLWGYAGTFGSGATGDLVSVNTVTGELLTVCAGLPAGIDSLALAGPALPPAVIPASTNWFIAAIIMLFIGFGGIFGYKRFG
jgi:hypothetical protein